MITRLGTLKNLESGCEAGRPVGAKRRTALQCCGLLVWFCLLPPAVEAGDPDPADVRATVASIDKATLESALNRSGENRDQIERALAMCADEHQAAVRFLVAYMPDHDLRQLKAEYIIRNVEYAYRAREMTPWGKQIPDDIFLNDVLPYASVNERRDDWRKPFFDKFMPLIKDCTSPAEAAQILNRDMYKLLDVNYHARRRPKPDQSPFESMEAKYASCTGLSILLIDACRAVCVPARFAGTPRWANKRGNHSWVEIWDGDWNFTGACEYNAGGLNKTWFQRDASHAIKDDPLHSIYASSWMTTGTTFPLIWNRQANYVAAVNVTDRYVNKESSDTVQHQQVLLEIDVRAQPGGQRVVCDVVILEDGREIKKAKSNGPNDDTNHRLQVVLAREKDYQIRFAPDGEPLRSEWLKTGPEARQSLTLFLDSNTAQPKVSTSSTFRDALATYLKQSRDDRDAVTSLPLGQQPLEKHDARHAAEQIWSDHAQWVRQTRAEEMQAGEIRLGEKTMKFHFAVYGDKPAGGRRLFISLHGGGGAPARVNDRQWENQKRLYEPAEGVYLAPRAPTNTWNLWHQSHIDPMFDRLIENLVVFEDVDPNRVYVMGYSAGGDGVYQLAPRMADRWAAAAMMAGHPNDASPLGLFNIGFALHVGGNDSAYKRNEVAAKWKERLAELQQDDADGYRHQAVIHQGKGHWMERQDAMAVPWMAEFTRDPFPRKIVWKQDDVSHARYYWLLVDQENERAGSLVRARRDGQTIYIQSEDIDVVTVLLNDQMLDLDQSVTIFFNGQERFQGKLDRKLENLAISLSERADPAAMFSARVKIQK